MMKGETPVLIAEPPVRRTQRASRADRAAANPVGDPLFDALRAMRRELAAEAGVPPYVIFHDAVLRAMASERSEEHTSELQSLMRISYAVFCLKNKRKHGSTDGMCYNLSRT